MSVVIWHDKSLVCGATLPVSFPLVFFFCGISFVSSSFRQRVALMLKKNQGGTVCKREFMQNYVEHISLEVAPECIT